MPIYEFRCPACAAEFERIVFSQLAAAEMSCPHCEATGVERLMSVFSSNASSFSESSSSGMT